MKFIFNLKVPALLLVSSIAIADESKKIETIPDTEPTKCYEMAWGSAESEGLGLSAGQAVELCSGATDANTVILCLVKAWSHPGNDGLGLTAGQAVSLCKTNSLQNAL